MLENKFVEASFMVAEKWKLYTLILKVFYSNNKFEGVKFKAGKEATEILNVNTYVTFYFKKYFYFKI